MRSSTPISWELEQSLHLLRMDPLRFQRIQTTALKKEYLDYHFTRLEFSVMSETDLQLQQQQLDEIDHAYEQILSSPLFADHTDEYGRDSIGLQRLMTQRQLATSNALEQSSLEDSIIVHGAKKAGVEPGFMATMAKDHYLQVRKIFPDKTARRDMMQFIAGNTHLIQTVLKDKMPTYMFKLAYQKISAGGKVSPNEADLERSTTMKQLKASMPALLYQLASKVYQSAKTKQFDEFNLEAVQEVLANDIARVYGMTVQEQALYPAQYDTGRLQLLLLGKWLLNATELGADGKHLAGAKDHQYLAKPLLHPVSGLTHRSDTGINKLSEMLCVMLLLGDRDGVGSRAQNKMLVNNAMVGIDFGKAFQSQELLKAVRQDFSLPDSVMKEFHNYTIFYDAPRSEFVRGLLRIARISGVDLDDDVITSYGDDFKLEMNKIQMGADERVFDDYIKFFRAYMESDLLGEGSAREANRFCCEKIIKKVEEIKARALSEKSALLGKFKCYLSLEKQVVDLLANIEKVVAGKASTSLRSKDDKVLLQHLRIKQNDVLGWSVECDANKNYKACAFFSLASKARAAATTVQKWIGQDDLACVSVERKKVIFQIPRNQLEMFCTLFDEDRIKSEFHESDYQELRNAHLEDMIVQSLSSWSVYGIDTSLIYVAGLCQLQIKKRQDAEIDPRFLALLNKTLTPAVAVDGVLHTLTAEKSIKTLHEAVDEITNFLEAENENILLLKEYQAYCQHPHDRWYLPEGLVLTLSYHAGEVGEEGAFSVALTTNDELLAKIIRKQDFFQTGHRCGELNKLDEIMMSVSVHYHHEMESRRLQEMSLRKQHESELAQMREREKQLLQVSLKTAQLHAIRSAAAGLRVTLTSYAKCLLADRSLKRLAKSIANYSSLYSYQESEAVVLEANITKLIEPRDEGNVKLMQSAESLLSLLDARRKHLAALIGGKPASREAYQSELNLMEMADTQLKVILELREVCSAELGLSKSSMNISRQ